MRSARPCAPPISSASTDAFRKIAAAARVMLPDVLITPYLTTGATDGRHYAGLTKNIYRFLPLRLIGKDLSRFHGVDERIGVADYQNMIRFYAALLAP